ncbi:hypothetical protein PM082_023065 [Marasmius tenuissimus]|nr:hypothetical protein PM082_023065 [Marasmius tenuissimus]
MALFTRLDDRDSRIHYTPDEAWFLEGLKTEYMGTTTGTKIAGALMNFNFTGTGVEVYGTATLSPTILNFFTIDGGTPVQWPQNPQNWSGPRDNVKMFGVRDLEDGAHTLVMQVTVKGSGTWIDYLDIANNESSQQTSDSTPSGETPSSTSEGLHTTSTTSDMTGQVSVNEAKHSLSLGATAGIAVGAMSGLFLIILLIVWGLRRRWRRIKSLESSEGAEAGELDQMNSSLTSCLAANTAQSNGQVRPFPLSARPAEILRKHAVQPPPSDGGHQPNTPRRVDDSPPSYAL